MKKIYLALVLLVGACTMQAQITVTQSSNSQTLSQLLAGSGVTISNYTLSCSANGSGTFTNTNTNLGMPGGVILASGRVQNVPNASNVFASTQFTATGDAQLSTLTTGTIYDPCVLQFDIVPQGPLLKFDYVFASEEYPEWVCSRFNDVFGFFITGPNPGGGTYNNRNIALIDGTNLPVAINTINPGTPGANANGGTCNASNQSTSYSSLYTNNQVPVNTSIVYDGMTHLLTATAAVTPCQTYHLKIAIADVADRIYDSGVFLSAYSFNANPVSVTAVGNLDYAGFTSAYEGCVGGTFTLTLSQAQVVDMYVDIVVSGTATNGTDYTVIPTTVLIPAGQTSVNIDLNPLTDALTEGMESVTIATLNPCTGAVSSSATINIRDNIPATITASDTTLCPGQSAQLDANGGITYSWTPTAGLSNPNIKNPVATPTSTTTYICNMTFGACTKTVSQTIYVSNPSAAITANPAGTICNGGSVQLTATAGGVSPYTYLWSTGATSPLITATAGGNYNVTTTDAYGCTATATRALVISNLALTGTLSNVSCVGNSNGAIDITVTGANAPFTYSWNDGAASQDRTNLAAGTYTVTATNTVGCSVSGTYTITQPATNLTSTATNTSVTCNGGNNGSINLTPAGGVSPYTFHWSNNASTEDINTLTAGAYAVTVTDANGCTTNRSINITQPSAITTTETHVNATCAGGNGSIDLTVAGGISPYTYAWSNGTATQDIISVSANTYTVTVADANGCTVSRAVTVTQPGNLAATASNTDPACNGGTNGSISLSVTGGSTPYNYSWSNGATTATASNLTIGTYTVSITDANGCSITATSTLTQPQPLAVTATTTNVSCNGGNNGTITTTVTGGTAAYTYSWNGGVTTANRTNLTSGSYFLTVTDSHGCTATRSMAITQPTALTIGETHTNAQCNGTATGLIDITLSGGSPAYTYVWADGATTQDRNNLIAGTYRVTATDSKSCTVTASATITQPAVVAATISTTSPACNGASTGSITANATGGTSPYSFNWSNNSSTATLTAQPAGSYSVTVTDSRSCTATASGNITQPAAITITPTVTNATCAVGNDGTISLTVSGGTGTYSYNWGGGITTPNRSGLTAGTYTVTVTDGAGCTASLPVAVTQYGTGITLTSAVSNISCNSQNNGAINITVTGGISPVTYNWNGGITTEDRTNLAPGSYSVTVTDGAGCSAVSSNVITEPAAISISKNTTNVACYGNNTGAITVTVTGGTGTYTYNWGGGITTANRSNLVAGTYTLTVTDANSCQATNTTVITQPAAAVSVSASATAVSCFGDDNGAINLTTTGGTAPYAYLWSNGASTQNISNVLAGTYTATVTDANSCSATVSKVVSQPLAALVTDLTPSDALCYNGASGAVSQTVSGGTAPYSFVWNDGNTLQNRSGLSAGNYSVTVTDNNSCTALGEVAINQPSVINIIAAATNVNCFGENNGTITIETTGGTGATTYLWNTGSTNANLSGLIAGTYTVTVTDANSCTASKAVTITQPSALAISLNSGTSVCANATGTATVVTNNTGSAPYNYTWSNGGANSQNQNGLAPGPISVTVTDSHGCSVTSSINVGVSGNNTNAAYTYTGAPCGPNATINFSHTGSNNVTHFWDFGDAAASSSFSAPAHTFAAAGTYLVTHVVTRGFCLDSVKQTVTILSKPIINAQNYNVSCNGLNNGRIDLTITSGTSPYTFNWGNSITTEDRNNLAPGTYTVTVTDATPCSASFSAAITQPTPLAVSYSSTPVSCFGGNNGTLTVSVTGGTTGYTYLWNDGNTTATRNGLAGGTYVVTVTDANLCTGINSISVYQPAAISLTTQVNNLPCYNQGNGSVAVSASGGTGAYSYNWGNGNTTSTLTTTLAGTYTVSVTDAHNCSTSTSATIAQPAVLSATLTATSVSCTNGNNGSISTTTTGGTSPYAYLWNDNNIGENRYTISAGNYSVTVTDINSCTATAAIAVTQPSTAVSLQTTAITHINCYNDSTGSISISANGGTPAYNFNWSDGSTLQNRNNLQAGNYNISVTDANGCQASVSAAINQPAQQLSIDTVITTNVLCYGTATGSISTTISGGTTPYTYNWGGGINTPGRSNIVAGSYQVTVTDNKGCSVSASATITQPAAALAATLTKVNPTCAGNANGSIDLTVSGGVTPYTFNWGNNVTTEDRTNITAGTYNVTVTDANSCTVTRSATLTQPGTLSTTIASTTNVSCFGGSNGAITTLTTGGTTAYSYIWNDGITTANRANITSGNYSITTTDANGCSATASAAITQPASALATSILSSTNVACYGGNTGAIVTTTTGGTSAYTYIWNDNNTNANRVGLSAGTYAYTVTDAHNCTATANTVITQPASALAATVVSANPTCAGNANGSIDLTVIGGVTPYTYNWGNNITTQDRTNIVAGTYSVTVTDANSCTVTRSATLTQPGTLSTTIASTTNVSCYGGSNGAIATTTTGGTTAYNYIWNDGITTANRANINSGNYSITTTDANGCSTTASATITQPASALATNISSSTNVACYGGNTGAITTTTTGGTSPYAYIWNDNNTNANRNGLAAGTYTYTVTDAHNCTATANTIITQPASALSVSVSSAGNISCAGGNNGTIQVIANGGSSGYSYNWGGGITTPTRNGLPAGTYSVTVTDANQCSAIASATLTQPQTLQAAVNKTDVTCYNAQTGSAGVVVTGGTPAFSYLWSNGATTRTIVNLRADTYTVTITDANACQLIKNATVTQPTPLAINSTKTDVLCNGNNSGSINATISGGVQPYQYLWSNSATTEDIAALTAGSYNLTLTDANNCTASASVAISQPAALALYVNGINPVCTESTNGAINLSVSGGVAPAHFIWSNGSSSQSLNNIGTGTYSVLATDANGCTATATASLVVTNPLSVTETHTDITCHGLNNATINSHVAGGTQPYQYLWSNNATSSALAGLTAGSYSVIVTDANGCTASTNAVALTNPALLGVGLNITPVACAGQHTGSITTIANGGTLPYTYNWSNSMHVQSLTNVAAGTYTLTLTDANGCSQTANATINTLPQLDVTAEANDLACYSPKGFIDLTVTNGTGPFTYQWNNGATTQDLANVYPGTYSVTVHDGYNCALDTAFIIVNQNTFTVTASGGGTIKLGETTELHVTTSGSQQTVYNWSPTFGMDCSTCADVNVQPGHSTVFTVVGIDTNGCEAKDTVSVTVIEDHEIFTPNAFSPNGDGNNDNLQLFGNLGGIKTFELLIFDRWGEKVFETTEPTFSWDGTYKGVNLGPTVCVYVMNIVFLDGYREATRKGSITLIR